MGVGLRVFEPIQVSAIELDMFDGMVEGVVLGVSRVDRDFVFWTWLMTWNGALVLPMRKDMES